MKKEISTERAPIKPENINVRILKMLLEIAYTKQKRKAYDRAFSTKNKFVVIRRDS